MIWGAVVILSLSSCSVFRSQISIVDRFHGECDKKIVTIFKNSPTLKGHAVGFALYDVDQKRNLCEYNADKYFTAASNMNLFNFYTGLKMLRDSLPVLRYISVRTLWFFGEQVIPLCCILYSRGAMF